MKIFSRIAGSQGRKFCAIALAVLIGFSFAACGGSSPSDDDTLPWDGSEPVSLTENKWGDGSFATETEQWFNFTATAAEQYIFLNFTGTDAADVQVYTEAGDKVDDYESLSANGYAAADIDPKGAGSFSRDLTVGDVYYIGVQVDEDADAKGAFRVAFTKTSESPSLVTWGDEDVTDLTVNTWAAEGDNENADQWYKFTATAATHYAHIMWGSTTYFNIQLYGSAGGAIGNGEYVSTAYAMNPLAVEIGEEYYIRVFDNASGGTFQIGVTDSTTPPPIDLPNDFTTLSAADTWVAGAIENGAAEWYKFTANAAEQYVHFEFTTMYNVMVEVYDDEGYMVGTTEDVDVEVPYLDLDLTNGKDYYVHVMRGAWNGAFNIAFSDAAEPPAITLPNSNVTEITVGEWTTATTAHTGATSKTWFSFTANAATQYIHIKDVSIEICLRLYDADGEAVGAPVSCGPQANNTYHFSRTVTDGSVYYIKAEGSGYSTNDYKITVNASETPPAQG